MSSTALAVEYALEGDRAEELDKLALEFIKLYDKYRQHIACANTYTELFKGSGISQELQGFLCDWIRGQIPARDKSVQYFFNAVLRSTGSRINYPIFRGCHHLNDGLVESYSFSPDVAAKFAREDGYVVSLDPDLVSLKGIDITGFCCWLDYQYDLLSDLKIYLHEYVGEGEFLVKTNLSVSCIFKVVQASGLY